MYVQFLILNETNEIYYRQRYKQYNIWKLFFLTQFRLHFE